MSEKSETGKQPQQYSKELIEHLRSRGAIYGENAEREIKRLKDNDVWGNLDFKRSVLGALTTSMTDFLRPEVDGHNEEGIRDYSYTEKKAEQILNDPLAYLNDLCDNNSSIPYNAKILVREGGLSQEEAKELIDQALLKSKHTRQDVQGILDIREMGKQAFDLLQNLDVSKKPITVELSGSDKPVDELKEKIRTMMGVVNNKPDLSERNN